MSAVTALLKCCLRLQKDRDYLSNAKGLIVTVVTAKYTSKFSFVMVVSERAQATSKNCANRKIIHTKTLFLLMKLK